MADTFKHAAEKLPIALRFTRYLGTGETISSAEITILPSGGLAKEGSYTINGGVVTQIVSGGTVGTEYRVTFKVTTSTTAVYVDIYTVRVIQ